MGLDRLSPVGLLASTGRRTWPVESPVMSTSTIGTSPVKRARCGSSVEQRTASQGTRSIVARLGDATLRALGPRSVAGCNGFTDVDGTYDATLSRIQQFRGACTSMIGRSQPTRSTTREDTATPMTNGAGTC